MSERALPDPRRHVPVRLSDIPLDKRLIAARHAMRQETTADERQSILIAALFPSNRIYWIAPP